MHGDPVECGARSALTLRPLTTTPIKEAKMAAKDFTRFESKFVRVPFSGCWLWTGSLVRGGYGLFQLTHRPNKRCESAHRVSYRLYRGEIPGEGRTGELFAALWSFSKHGSEAWR